MNHRSISNNNSTILACRRFRAWPLFRMVMSNYKVTLFEIHVKFRRKNRNFRRIDGVGNDRRIRSFIIRAAGGNAYRDDSQYRKNTYRDYRFFHKFCNDERWSIISSKHSVKSNTPASSKPTLQRPKHRQQIHFCSYRCVSSIVSAPESIRIVCVPVTSPPRTDEIWNVCLVRFFREMFQYKLFDFLWYFLQ